MPFAMLLCGALFANFVLVAGHDNQRILEIGTLLLGGICLLICRRMTLTRLFSGTSGKLLAVFFLLGVLGSITAFAPRLAFFEVSTFFLLYAIAGAIAAEIAGGGPIALHTVTQLLGVAGALYTFLFFVAYVGSFGLGIPLDVSDFTPGFSNIRFFNHTQTSTLPLLVLLCCLTPRSARLRWLWLAVTAYWWMALFATSGRGTLVGTMAGAVVVAAFLRRTAAPYLKQLAWTAALGLLAYFVLLVAIPALFGQQGMNAFSTAVERTAADPASGRMLLWRRAAELIAQHPLLGVGPMHFAHHAGDLHIGAHPHDWLMQIGSEWGLPALGCLLVAIGLALRALLRAGRHVATHDMTNKTIHAALLAAAVAILVDGLVSGLFVMPQSQLAIALYLGCAFGWYRSVVPAPLVVTSSVMPRFGAVVLVIAAMAGLAGTWPEMKGGLEGGPLTAQQQAANMGTQWPRLWKAGYF
jgi:O-antigen ligase